MFVNLNILSLVIKYVFGCIIELRRLYLMSSLLNQCSHTTNINSQYGLGGKVFYLLICGDMWRLCGAPV